MYYVIKAGGSGNFIETNCMSNIEWLNYRRFQINSEYFSELVDALYEASKENKIAYINGGVGAYLFIKLGERLGLDESQLNIIGCDIINITSTIILEALIKKSSNIYPELVVPSEFKESIFDSYDIGVFKAMPQFISSDSLSTFIASKGKNTKQIFFKKGVPIYHTGYSKPTKVDEFKISLLEEISQDIEEEPGSNFIIDKQSIDLIKKFNIDTTFYNSDDISNLSKILKNSNNEFRKTKIIL